MKIVIAGGAGFIGRQLSQLLNQEGHSVIVLSRKPRVDAHSNPRQIRYIEWDGCKLGPWTQECDGAEVVMNLSGGTHCR